MSEYVTITWGSTGASSSAAAENNSCIIGRDPTYSGTEDSFTVTSVDAALEAGVTIGSDVHRALVSHYGQSGVGQAQCVVVVSDNVEGTSYSNIIAVGEVDGETGVYNTPTTPVQSITSVTVDFGDGSGAISQTGKYTATALGSIYTGEITFASDGPIDGAGVHYSGYVPEDATVYMSYTTSALQECFNLAYEEDVQFIMMAQDPHNPTAYSASLISDMKQLARHATACVNANRWRTAIASIPAANNPNTSDVADGGSSTWGNLKSEIGTTRNLAVIKTNPTTTGGVGDDDGAAVLMGTICRTPPHEMITLKDPTISQTSFDNETQKNAWKKGQVATLAQFPTAETPTTRITYGFTFGSGRESRIENVRCRNLIARILYQRIYALITSAKARYDLDGLNLIAATIQGAMNYAQSLGYHEGLNSVTITGYELFNTPYSKLTTAQKTQYATLKDAGVVYAEIEYVWATSVEKISINPVIEV